MLEMLLRAGMDPNLADYDARTALHFAACYGQLMSGFTLISYHANVNAEDRWHCTPLENAL